MAFILKCKVTKGGNSCMLAYSVTVIFSLLYNYLQAIDLYNL